MRNPFGHPAHRLRGPAGAGKTHLMCAAGLLLEYPQVWPSFIGTHPEFGILGDRVAAARPIVVVPIPLAEHRGHDEHLEDNEVVWACWDAGSPIVVSR